MMTPYSLAGRRQLEERLAGLDALIGPRPSRGWLWTIRTALGMSTYELGPRIGVTASRVRQLELAEVAGSIKLSVLDRTARTLQCRLLYVLVPYEPLDQIVMRQARRQATRVLASSNSRKPTGTEEPDIENDPRPTAVEVELLANQLAVLRGLWTENADGK